MLNRINFKIFNLELYGGLENVQGICSYVVNLEWKAKAKALFYV